MRIVDAHMVGAPPAPPMKSLRAALSEGGWMRRALLSTDREARQGACSLLREAAHAALRISPRHACVSADDVFTDGATVVVRSDEALRSPYEDAYNARGDTQAPFSLAASMYDALGPDGYRRLCENMKCFMQSYLMHTSGWPDACPGVHEAPVSSGITVATALKILESDTPSAVQPRSPPDLQAGRGRSDSDVVRLLSCIEDEGWPPDVKAQARRAVSLASHSARKGRAGLTDADLLPDNHSMWTDCAAVASFNSVSTHSRRPIAPGTPVKT